ncbi:MAG: glycoside hydrolase family 127 protein [Gemmatimonadetes bacterium]|nr:glycoside hydrolase family 127 protein [Gemmatimonadota bacterium]
MSAPIPEQFRSLPLGAVLPAGWLRTQLEENLAGFTGHLDALVPALVVQDDLYGRDRLTPAVREKDVGAQGVPPQDRAQFLWWNSETQGNWWDGLLRTAVLLQDAAALARAARQVDALLATQDASGYLGIYAPALRYQVIGEHGELWAKTTALRYLLGWYEHTRQPHVLDAVRRSVEDVMTHYPIGASQPFRTDRPDTCGLTHGLAFTDVLEHLHRLTGDRRYADYIAFLYADFSAQPLAEDAQPASLLDPAQPLRGHGVHTYEHLRCVAAAYHATGAPRLGDALAAFERKVREVVLPSGGPVGDEYIDGRGKHGGPRGYEYCSLQELLHSQVSLLCKRGDAALGDAIERLFLNAAQGARHPDGRGIAYLASDNAFAMTGALDGNPQTPTQTRYKYSPVHQDAAVCCVPNAGRIAPTYVQHMWLRDGDALVAALLGPCTLRTPVAGRTIEIVQDTTYPSEDTVHFTVIGARDGLALRVRRPAWATQVHADLPFVERDGFLRFTIPRGDAPVAFGVTFGSRLVQHRDGRGDAYFTDGPCVLARALPAYATITKRYDVPEFADRTFTTPDPVAYRTPGAVQATRERDAVRRWRVALHDPRTSQPMDTLLEPMAHTILRQVTFAPADRPSSPDPTDR